MADRGDGTPGRQALGRECRILFRYAFGGEPGERLMDRYVAGHRALGDALSRPADRMDAFLLRAGRRGPTLARLADAWARFFRPGALIRRKLALLVAIAESEPGAADAFDSPDAPARLRFLGAAVLRAAGFALTLAAALLLFGPPALLWRGRSP